MAVNDVIALGNFQGNTGLRGKVYWSQRETSTPGVSKVIVDLYIYTQYGWGNYALAGCIININGNMYTTTSSVNVNGSGERKVMSHSALITHNGELTIRIETKLVVRGTYQGTYYSDVYTMGNVTLKAPALLQSRIKTGSSTYSPIRKMYIKTSSTGYSLVKAAYIKTSSTAYTRIK